MALVSDRRHETHYFDEDIEKEAGESACVWGIFDIAELIYLGPTAARSNTHTFLARSGTRTTVAQYFASLGHQLRYPSVICIQVGLPSR